MSTNSTETIWSGDEPAQLPRRVRRPSAPTPGARTTALTAALSLVLAGGVATAAYRSSTGAVDPTSLVPASAFAVATIDLSAPGDALGDFADNFPGSPTHDGEGSAVDRLLRPMFDDPSEPRFSYDKTLRPWLGDHVAIAGWLDDGKPRLLAVLESEDDDAARKLLGPAMEGDGAFRIHDHYVVISDTDDIVGRAIAAADNASLADHTTYAADVAALPNDEAVVGWADGAGAKKALSSAMGGFGSPEEMFGDNPLLAMSGNPFEQRVALGLHVTGDYVQADLRTYGAAADAAKTAPSTLVTQLPSGTIGAVAFSGVDTFVDTMFGFIRDFAGIAGPQELCTGAMEGTFSPELVTPARPLNRREAIQAKRRAIRRAMRQAESQGSTGAESFGCTSSEPVDPIKEIEQTTGLSLPDDVKTLLGDRMVIAFGGMNLTGLPDVAVRTHPADVDQARPIAEKLAAALAASSDLGLSVETPDDELVVATTSAYAQLVAKSGDLGEDDAFTAAMGQVPDEVSSAAFIDLTRIWPLIEAQGADVGDAKHLHSFGVWTSRDGDVQVAQMRLTAG